MEHKERLIFSNEILQLSFVFAFAHSNANYTGLFSWKGVDRPPMTNTRGERVVARRRLQQMVKGLRPRQVEPRPSDETGAGEARPDGLQAAERSELAFRAQRETRPRLDRWRLFELCYIYLFTYLALTEPPTEEGRRSLCPV